MYVCMYVYIELTRASLSDAFDDDRERRREAVSFGFDDSAWACEPVIPIYMYIYIYIYTYTYIRGLTLTLSHRSLRNSARKEARGRPLPIR